MACHSENLDQFGKKLRKPQLHWWIIGMYPTRVLYSSHDSHEVFSVHPNVILLCGPFLQWWPGHGVHFFVYRTTLTQRLTLIHNKWTGKWSLPLSYGHTSTNPVFLVPSSVINCSKLIQEKPFKSALYAKNGTKFNLYFTKVFQTHFFPCCSSPCQCNCRVLQRNFHCNRTDSITPYKPQWGHQLDWYQSCYIRGDTQFQSQCFFNHWFKCIWCIHCWQKTRHTFSSCDWLQFVEVLVCQRQVQVPPRAWDTSRPAPVFLWPDAVPFFNPHWGQWDA